MLKDFHYPLSRKERSTLNPTPSLASADFMYIELGGDPSAVATLLPGGLDIDRFANGHRGAFVYDWQFSGENEEYLDPARCQYREVSYFWMRYSKEGRSRKTLISL